MSSPDNFSFTSKYIDIKELYSERIKSYGLGPEGLGWGKKDRRNLRFKVLVSQWNFEGQRLLDFGCGFGDLYGYLRQEGIQCDYLGVDINPEMVALAKSQYPEANFKCLDLLADEFSGQFDFVLSSGVFNDKRKDSNDFIERVLKKLNKLTQKGMAINFLSSQAEIKYEHANYNDPIRILKYCYEYSNNIVLRNDYMPFEFTVFINKASAINKAAVVYEEYVNFI